MDPIQIRHLDRDALYLWNANHLGIRINGVYGLDDVAPFNSRSLALRSSFLGRPLTAEDLEELHGVDASAPANTTCSFCQRPIDWPIIRSAIVADDGDLIRDQKTGEIIYRGHFVVIGIPVEVHAAHAGACMLKLRDSRCKIKEERGRKIRDLLPNYSYKDAQNFLSAVGRRVQEARSVEEDRRSDFHTRLFGKSGYKDPGQSQGKKNKKR